MVDDPAPLAEEEPEREEAVAAAGAAAAPDGGGGLVTALEELSCRMPSELDRCSAQQLVQLHCKLGDMMRDVVAQLHLRVRQSESEA